LRRTEGGQNGKGSRGRSPRGRAEGEGAAPRRESRRPASTSPRPADADDPDASRLAELRATCEELQTRIAKHQAESRRAKEKLLAEIADRKRAETKVNGLRREIEETQREIIYKLAEIVEVRSQETGTHVRRVGELSAFLAGKCGLDAHDVELIRLSAPMHDVGKVGIPDAILHNPGKLTPAEFEVMKTHTTAGYEMLRGSSRKILKSAALIALQHHEKFNGQGYPLGLKGDRIHIYGRLTCLADVFDALSSDRIYRAAWEHDRILAYLKAERGKSFDPYLLDVLFDNLAEFVAIHRSIAADDHGGSGVREAPSPPPQADHAPPADAPEPPPTSAEPVDDAEEPIEASEQRARSVLLAVNDPLSRRRLAAALEQWRYDVVAVGDGHEAWTLLQHDHTPRLVILDQYLPGMDGPAICRAVRRLSGDDYVYIILLTTEATREDALAGIDAGADACVAKPYDPGELRVRMRAARRILRLQAELLATRESLRRRATRDALTGLWNRAAILELLEQELARAKREDISVGVLMADLDHFKRINDTYGHRVGDAVLHQAAKRMRDMTRPYDLIGRYGGEEFLVIVPRCDATFAAYVAERIRAAIEDEPFQVAEHAIPLTISLGVVAQRGLAETDANSLVIAADQALYRAKDSGRNTVNVAQLEPAA
jgi:diguanylate cyclase (GGDEF)-like protein